jgi:hypothetical protein
MGWGGRVGGIFDWVFSLKIWMKDGAFAFEIHDFSSNL